MNIDTTLTITIAIIAIVSPIFTAIINNRYQLRIKKIDANNIRIENSIIHARESLEKTISALGACLSFKGDISRELTKDVLSACAYVNEDTSAKIISAYSCIVNRQHIDTDKLVELVSELRKAILKLNSKL